MPDDESDRVTHRNGRFINNVFVPKGAVAPPETTVIAGIGNSRTPKVLDSSIAEKPKLVLKPSRRARKAKSYNRQWNAIPKVAQYRKLREVFFWRGISVRIFVSIIGGRFKS